MPRRTPANLEVPDPYASGRFPFSAQTHAAGQRLLFDLATVLMVLDCRPGDRVLDVGAGAGFSSEILARFGYDVIAVDPDRRMLACNRDRVKLDPSRIDGRVHVIQGTAEDLPCADASFDGIIGLNVMHHVPDLPRAVKELARVLRPGCRAVFSEPGLEHLETIETKRATQEHGEGDQPFDYIDFAVLGEMNGFSHSLATATLHPVFTTFQVSEIELYASGEHYEPLLTTRGLAHALRHQHPFVILIREGQRPRTSRYFHPTTPRYAGDLLAALEVDNVPRHATAGDTLLVKARAKNTGNATWLAEPSIFGGFVSFGCKLLAADGRLIDDRPGRTALEADVPPGGEVEAEMAITLPADLQPGPCTLAFDMVDEFVCWFSDLKPDTVVSRHVVVTSTPE